MCAKAVRWARRQETGGPPEKAVLLVLADEANRSGISKLSIRRIAKEVNTDPGTVSEALERLRHRHLVSWETGRGRSPNAYRLHR